MIRILAASATALALSACSILPDPAPADIIYRLSLDGESVPAKADATVIRIDRPSSSSMFDSASIIVSPDGRRLSRAAQAKWAEALPLLIQQSLVDAFSRDADIIGVIPSSGTRTDTRVHLTIKNFEAQFDRGEEAAPLAVVRYTATLANASDRMLIDTFVTRHEVRADAARVSEIVEALEQANNAAMMDIVSWVSTADDRGDI
ncbi:MAG: ABC-type transport auxiliary lipoprotein family protein [Litorimonas sp.]